eukprot:TRINITY_DN28185_c0_g1_i1.p1 TRINITY_DN28185_c0_g1~~TRINITY_DN28185_c0_g1_i1.p1  ORF type:complete len:627 (+),score=89.81 TRINITY_DN28185_c0_g1_i1:217-1881(+)
MNCSVASNTYIGLDSFLSTSLKHRSFNFLSSVLYNTKYCPTTTTTLVGKGQFLAELVLSSTTLQLDLSQTSPVLTANILTLSSSSVVSLLNAYANASYPVVVSGNLSLGHCSLCVSFDSTYTPADEDRIPVATFAGSLDPGEFSYGFVTSTLPSGFSLVVEKLSHHLQLRVLGICANGYYRPTSLDPCGLCPAGSYCINGFQYDCPAGSYCPKQGTTDPLTCPPTYYCPTNTITPLPCASGYTSESGSADCREVASASSPLFMATLSSSLESFSVETLTSYLLYSVLQEDLPDASLRVLRVVEVTSGALEVVFVINSLRPSRVAVIESIISSYLRYLGWTDFRKVAGELPSCDSEDLEIWSCADEFFTEGCVPHPDCSEVEYCASKTRADYLASTHCYMVIRQGTKAAAIYSTVLGSSAFTVAGDCNGKKLSCSSGIDSTVTDAIDGNFSTSHVFAAGASQFLVVDLGSCHTVSRVLVYATDDSTTVQPKAEIQVTSHGLRQKAWKTVAKFETLSESAQQDTPYFVAAQSRYFRILLSSTPVKIEQAQTELMEN